MSEGPGNSWFLPEGVHRSVQHKQGHVVEPDAALHAELQNQHALDAAARHGGPWPTAEHVLRTPPSAPHAAKCRGVPQRHGHHCSLLRCLQCFLRCCFPTGLPHSSAPSKKRVAPT
jgi:hypothetical protein